NFKGVNATQQDLRYEQYQEFCRSLVDFGTKYLQVDDLIAFNNLSAKLSELFNPPVFDEMQEKLIIVNQNLNRYVATHFPHFKEFEDIYDWMKFLNYLVGPKDSEQARSLGSLTGVLFDSLKYESAAAAPIGSTEILDEAREENENSVPLVGRAAAEEVEGAVGIAIATSTLVEAETNDKSPVARKLDFGEADQAEQEFRVNYEEKLKDILKIKEVSENHEATLGNNFGIEKFKSFEEFLEFMRYCGGEIFNSEVILEGWAAEVEGLLSWVQEKLTEEQRLSQQVKEAHDSLLIPLLKEVVAETSFPETHIVQISQYVEPVPTHDYARFADLANQIKLMGRYLANQSIDYEMLLKELEEASLEKERLEAEAEILNNSVIEAEQKSPVDGLAATEGENELEAGGLAEIEKAKAEFSSNQESINSIDNAIRSIQDNISKKSFASKMIIEAYDALVSSMLADLGKYDYLEPQLRSFSEAIKSFVNKEAPVYYYDLKEFIDSFDILLAQVRQVLLEQDVVVWRKIVEQREEAVEQLQENKVALGSKEISPATIVPQEITYERHPLFTEENCAFLKEYEGRLLTSEALESYAPMNPLPPSRSQRKIALHAMSPITPFNPDSKEPEILRVKIETKQAELRKSLQLADDDNSSIVAFANSAKLEGAGKYDFGLPVLPEVLNTKLEREVDLLLHCYVL
ncbi:MAG TPA: hypothetical protein VD770_01385, partial [Coxiellaceae bacterium]|nr:hypothetical protein [Coxiellaceae bacterium]